ncbi:MAG: caspase family protein [Verrucomicrobiaceae bacterium]
MRSLPLFLLAVCLPSTIMAAGRHALILCNQNYTAVGALKTPLAEAKAAEETLKTLGFAGNITVVTDASTAKMIEVVDTFTSKLKDAEVALFFYGGHAIQAAGENYLLGVDSDPATTSQLAYKALPLGRVLTNLEGSGAKLNLLILDCCRDNPLPTRGRNIGSTRGLAPTANAPKGTFIAYAADANQQAWDDHGQIGLYGSVLFEKMKTPGLRLEDIFIQTREEVAKIATEKYQHQQEPAEYSKVSGAFYFVSKLSEPSSNVGPVPTTPANMLGSGVSLESDEEKRKAVELVVAASTVLPQETRTDYDRGIKGPASNPLVVRLWPAGAPEPKGFMPEPEKVIPKKNERDILRVTNVSDPTISVYKAPDPNDTAVIVCPGGGYSILATEHEGTAVCAYLNTIGVTGILLKYRVPRRDEEDPAKHPLQDLQRAISLVRSSGSEWGVQVKRIGVLGFSAGAHLAALAAINPKEPTYPRDGVIDVDNPVPDFAVLLYPAYLAKDKNTPMFLDPRISVTDRSPPICIMYAKDDPLFGTGSAALLYLEYVKRGRPAKLIVYNKGGHGFGMLGGRGFDADNWPSDLTAWMKSMGWF